MPRVAMRVTAAHVPQLDAQCPLQQGHRTSTTIPLCISTGRRTTTVLTYVPALIPTANACEFTILSVIVHCFFIRSNLTFSNAPVASVPDTTLPM